MKFNILVKLTLPLVVLFLTGCSLPSGGTCKYETFNGYAIVKDIKKDHILVDPYPKGLGTISKYISIQPYPVDIGEVLPGELSVLVDGSCAPGGFSIKDKEFFGIKKSVVYFSDNGEGIIEKDADQKITEIAKYFLALKKDYPDSILILYGHASKGTDEYRYSLALTWYAQRVKDKLLEKGLSEKSLLIIAYDTRTEDKVTFSVDLGI